MRLIPQNTRQFCGKSTCSWGRTWIMSNNGEPGEQGGGGIWIHWSMTLDRHHRAKVCPGHFCNISMNLSRLDITTEVRTVQKIDGMDQRMKIWRGNFAYTLLIISLIARLELAALIHSRPFRTGEAQKCGFAYASLRQRRGRKQSELAAESLLDFLSWSVVFFDVLKSKLNPWCPLFSSLNL